MYRHHLLTCVLQKVLEKIKKTAAKTVDGAKPQCFVLFILTHGGTDSNNNEQVMYGTDGQPLTKTEIIDLLDNCPNLKSVPRLLFLQCCRGGTIDIFRFLVSALYAYVE